MTADQAFELALDEALQLLASGVSREECLRRFPQYAADFEPLLAAAESARAGLLADQPVPQPNLARGKRRVLEMARAPSKLGAVGFTWRLAGALLVLALVVSVTGAASANALPGEALYPVKRTFEIVQLRLAFDPLTRTRLEAEQAARRRAEAQVVLNLQRETRLEFEGVVESVQSTALTVSGLSVLTDLAQTFQPGDQVRVSAYTARGMLVAEAITLLARPTPLSRPTTPATSTPSQIPATSTRPTRDVTATPQATQTVTRHVPTQTPTATRRVEGRLTPRSEVTSSEARPTATPVALRLTDTTATVARPTPPASSRP